MRTLDAQRIEQPHGVRRHVVQVIRRASTFWPAIIAFIAASATFGTPSCDRCVESADVAIVEADDAEAARRQPFAQRHRPHGHLRRKAHDEQMTAGSVSAAEAFVFDLDPVGARLAACDASWMGFRQQLSDPASLDKRQAGATREIRCAAISTALPNERFDLLIIGGGVTGACVARDAALRGLKVALVEKNDFATPPARTIPS